MSNLLLAHTTPYTHDFSMPPRHVFVCDAVRVCSVAASVADSRFSSGEVARRTVHKSRSEPARGKRSEI